MSEPTVLHPRIAESRALSESETKFVTATGANSPYKYAVTHKGCSYKILRNDVLHHKGKDCACFYMSSSGGSKTNPNLQLKPTAGGALLLAAKAGDCLPICLPIDAKKCDCAYHRGGAGVPTNGVAASVISGSDKLFEELTNLKLNEDAMVRLPCHMAMFDMQNSVADYAKLVHEYGDDLDSEGLTAVPQLFKYFARMRQDDRDSLMLTARGLAVPPAYDDRDTDDENDN